jgi:hypothetical protein
VLHFLHIWTTRHVFRGPDAGGRWEQFFREKSARRAKRERLRVIGTAIVWAVVVRIAVASAIAAVSAK